MTTTAARGRGVGQAMGEAYLEFAPKLVRPTELRALCTYSKYRVNHQLAGIHILRLQFGIRQQPSLHPHLGEARLQRYWASPQSCPIGQ